MVVVYGPK